MLVQEENKNFLEAAIITALDIGRCQSVADALYEYFEKKNQQFLRFQDTVRLVHDIGTGSEIRKLLKTDRATYNGNPIRYLSTKESVVYLVYLAQHCVMNHVVVFDANRKLNIDSDEKYPLTLTLKM